MNAASVARQLQRNDSRVTVTIPGGTFAEIESGRAVQRPATTYAPYGVLVPETVAGDETAPAGALLRRVRAYLAAILPSGAPWPVPKAGHTITDATGTYAVEGVTVYSRAGAPLLYEVGCRA